MDHFEKYIKSSGLDVQMEYLGDQQLIALQVPSTLQELLTIPILYLFYHTYVMLFNTGRAKEPRLLSGDWLLNWTWLR